MPDCVGESVTLHASTANVSRPRPAIACGSTRAGRSREAKLSGRSRGAQRFSLHQIPGRWRDSSSLQRPVPPKPTVTAAALAIPKAIKPLELRLRTRAVPYALPPVSSSPPFQPSAHSAPSCSCRVATIWQHAVSPVPVMHMCVWR